MATELETEREPSARPRDAAAIAEQLKELAALYPEPDIREIWLDREWFYTHANQGELEYARDKVVGVFEQQVVGVGDDYEVMQIELSRKYGKHPERFYMVFHGEVVH